MLGVGLEVGLLVADVHGEAEDDRGGGEPGGRHPGSSGHCGGSAVSHQPHPSLACALYCPLATHSSSLAAAVRMRGLAGKQPHHGPGPSLTVLSSGQVFVPSPSLSTWPHCAASPVLLCSPLKILCCCCDSVRVSGCREAMVAAAALLLLEAAAASTLAQPLVTVRTRPHHTLTSSARTRVATLLQPAFQ